MILFQFSFFFLFFQFFSFVSCYVKQFLCGLHLFWEDIFFIFKESTVAKVSRISSSKSPSWYLVKFRSKFFFDKYPKNSVLIFFNDFFYSWSNGKTIKAPGFYYNTHLHINSICLKLDVVSMVVFINSNSVFADWTMWKWNTY